MCNTYTARISSKSCWMSQQSSHGCPMNTAQLGKSKLFNWLLWKKNCWLKSGGIHPDAITVQVSDCCWTAKEIPPSMLLSINRGICMASVTNTDMYYIPLRSQDLHSTVAQILFIFHRFSLFLALQLLSHYHPVIMYGMFQIVPAAGSWGNLHCREAWLWTSSA